jgi:hypothetical protein
MGLLVGGELSSGIGCFSDDWVGVAGGLPYASSYFVGRG